MEYYLIRVFGYDIGNKAEAKHRFLLKIHQVTTITILVLWSHYNFLQPMLNSESLDQIKQLNVSIYPADKQYVIDCLNDYFPEADLHELALQLIDAVRYIAYVWECQWLVMDYTGDGSILKLNYKGRGEYEELSVIHSFFSSIGDNWAELGYIYVPVKLRGKNLSRIIYSVFYSHYSAMGVKKMVLYAALTAGGYVWARAGFAATKKEEVGVILEKAYFTFRDKPDSIITQQDLNGMQYLFDNHYAHTPTEPFPIYLWAVDRNLGQEILVETQWDGVLDLRNVSQTAIFTTYLTTRP